LCREFYHKFILPYFNVGDVCCLLYFNFPKINDSIKSYSKFPHIENKYHFPLVLGDFLLPVFLHWGNTAYMFELPQNLYFPIMFELPQNLYFPIENRYHFPLVLGDFLLLVFLHWGNTAYMFELPQNLNFPTK